MSEWTFEVIPLEYAGAGEKRRWRVERRSAAGIQRAIVSYFRGRQANSVYFQPAIIGVHEGHPSWPQAIANARAEAHLFVAHVWKAIAETGGVRAEPEYLSAQNCASARVEGKDAAIAIAGYFGDAFDDSLVEVAW